MKNSFGVSHSFFTTKKLLLSYFTIVVFLAVLAMAALVAISHVNQNVHSMYEDRLKPLTFIAELGKYSENTRVLMVTAITTKDASLTKNVEENLQYELGDLAQSQRLPLPWILQKQRTQQQKMGKTL